MKLKLIILFSSILVIAALYILITKPDGLTGNVILAEEYKNISIKFYDAASKNTCMDLLELVPEEYLDGLKVIKVLPAARQRMGHYYEHGTLELFGCTFDSINHELAHHRQWMLNDTSYQLTHHQGRFYQFEREIFEVMWESNNRTIP